MLGIKYKKVSSVVSEHEQSGKFVKSQSLDSGPYGELCEDPSCTKQKEYCPKCPICAQNAEVKARNQYKALKEEYDRVCSQEAALRSHIALLGAELILMQTKQYHKGPSHCKKLSIDPVEIRRIDGKYSHCDLSTSSQYQAIPRYSANTMSRASIEYATRRQQIPVAVSKLRPNKSNVKGSRSENSKRVNCPTKFQPTVSKSEYQSDMIPQNLSYIYLKPPKGRPKLSFIKKPPVEFVTYHRLQKMRHARGCPG